MSYKAPAVTTVDNPTSAEYSCMLVLRPQRGASPVAPLFVQHSLDEYVVVIDRGTEGSDSAYEICRFASDFLVNSSAVD